MSRKLRSKTYEDYGISKKRYRELYSFCQQYQEFKDKLKYGISAVHNESVRYSNVFSDTENKAIHNVNLRKNIEMIEIAAKKNIPEYLYVPLLLNVTTGQKYEHLGNIPIGRADFYAYRRLFFHNLDQLRR